MNKKLDIFILFILGLGVVFFIPRGSHDVDAQSTSPNPTQEVLVNMDEPNALPMLNNMLRQQSNATATLNGYFNSSGLLNPNSGGTGANITSFPNGSVLIYNSGNVGIGTFSQGASGQFLESQGVGVIPIWGVPSHVQIFTISGTFTAPAGVYSVWVTLQGAGGSGGANTDSGKSGGGGGGGALVINAYYPVTPASNYSVTIGAGGTSVTADSNGVNGGSTIFNGQITAPGGAGASGGTGGINGGSGGSAPSTPNMSASGTSPGAQGYDIGRVVSGGSGSNNGGTGISGAGGASVFGNGGSPNNAGAGYGAGGGGASGGSSGVGYQGVALIQW